METVLPAPGHLLVARKPPEGERKTKGGLFLPASALKADTVYLVLKVPDVRLLEEAEVDPGDLVVLDARSSGTRFEHKGEEYVSVERKLVKAVIKNPSMFEDTTE